MSEFAWALSLILLLVAFYGRRRSLRTYERLGDLVKIADLVGIAVPEHPIVWREQARVIRKGSTSERLTLGIPVTVIAAGFILSYLEIDFAPTVIVYAIFTLPFVAASQRIRREREFRYAVHGGVRRVTAGDLQEVRRTLDDTIAKKRLELQRLEELRSQADEPDGQVGILDRILLELQEQRTDRVDDSRKSLTRDIVIAVASLVLGAILSIYIS